MASDYLQLVERLNSYKRLLTFWFRPELQSAFERTKCPIAQDSLSIAMEKLDESLAALGITVRDLESAYAMDAQQAEVVEVLEASTAFIQKNKRKIRVFRNDADLIGYLGGDAS